MLLLRPYMTAADIGLGRLSLQISYPKAELMAVPASRCDAMAWTAPGWVSNTEADSKRINV